jgi:hypothetical protein
MEIQDLNTEDQRTIAHVLDSLLRDAKAKKDDVSNPAWSLAVPMGPIWVW